MSPENHHILVWLDMKQIELSDALSAQIAMNDGVNCTGKSLETHLLEAKISIIMEAKKAIIEYSAPKAKINQYDQIAATLRSNINYFYAQTDGSHKFPSSAEGDLLKSTLRLLNTER
jgi:hypothetical protein